MQGFQFYPGNNINQFLIRSREFLARSARASLSRIFLATIQSVDYY